MSGKDDIAGIVGSVILFILLAAILAGGNDSTGPQTPITSTSETWRNYMTPPPNEDVLAHLENSQKLIISLGNDLSRVQAQNVDIQYALQTVNTQLSLIQQQAAEDAKRQTRENWKFAIIGIFGGWLMDRAAKFGGRLIEKRKNRTSQQVKEVPATKVEKLSESKDLIPENIPLVRSEITANDSSGAVSLPLGRLCPKCGSQMQIGHALEGEFKNRLVSACPNCHEIVPFK